MESPCCFVESGGDGVEVEPSSVLEVSLWEEGLSSELWVDSEEASLAERVSSVLWVESVFWVEVESVLGGCSVVGLSSLDVSLWEEGLSSELWVDSEEASLAERVSSVLWVESVFWVEVESVLGDCSVLGLSSLDVSLWEEGLSSELWVDSEEASLAERVSSVLWVESVFWVEVESVLGGCSVLGLSSLDVSL